MRRDATFRGLWAVHDFLESLRTLGGPAGIQRGTRVRTTSSTHFAAAMTLTVVLLSGLLELAEAAEYRPTFCGDIIMGYVPLGERVETEGWLWSFKDEIFLKPNQPSAMAPLTIDVGTLSAETVARIKAECTANYIATSAGCPAIVRGRHVLVVGKRGLLADEIRFNPINLERRTCRLR